MPVGKRAEKPQEVEKWQGKFTGGAQAGRGKTGAKKTR